ncbi:hypothetical protein [Foetidibacter luteolus]|uniref:hypothetical protein n=1 Tax=Foetidibacter luteolus TaxID=2608880 RepID=UPI00129A983F|nr:hypothetical protein [Foetidibacter luteolus]
MKNIISNINSYFFQPVPKQTLGIFRILVSSFAIVQLVVLLPDWMWLYGPKGLVPWNISDMLSTNAAPSIANIATALTIDDITAVYVVTIAYAISLASLLLGYKTRPMAIVAWLMHMVINTTGNLTAYGVETFAHISLFYCVVLPVGSSLSLDSRKKSPRIPAYLITLSVRVIQLHLCIMYLACGIEKAMGAQWWSGEAIWMAMQQDQFHNINIDWMARYPFVPKILCWGTLLLETFYPIGIYHAKTKKFWLAGIVSMHLGIALFLGLHLFGTLMALINISAFSLHCFPALLKAGRQNTPASRAPRRTVLSKLLSGLAYQRA